MGVLKGWDSIKLIGRVRERFKELLHKEWDWRSFYHGWLEGRADMYKQVSEDTKLLEEQLTSARKLISDIAQENYYPDTHDIAKKWLRENPEIK